MISLSSVASSPAFSSPAFSSPAFSSPALPSLALLSLTLLASGCSQDAGTPASTASRGTPVAVWVAESSGVAEERSWSGALAPLRLQPFTAPVDGRVATLSVRDGDMVAAGTPLLRLEDPEVEARREVLQERQGRLEEELARWRELAAAGAAGPGEVTAAELRLFDARESLAALDAGRTALQFRSGTAGRVVSLAVGPGAPVTAGQVLLAVEEAGTYGVRLRVPAAEARRFDEPDRLVLELGDGSRYAVARVVPGPDAQAGFVQVDLYPGAALVDGPPASAVRQAVLVRYRREEAGIVIPWTSVASDDARSWVAVAVPVEPEPGATGEAAETVYEVQRREVELGRARPDGIEVLSGVEPGDRVIRYEPRSHPEGRRVEPRPASGSASGSASGNASGSASP